MEITRPPGERLHEDENIAWKGTDSKQGAGYGICKRREQKDRRLYDTLTYLAREYCDARAPPGDHDQ